MQRYTLILAFPVFPRCAHCAETITRRPPAPQLWTAPPAPAPRSCRTSTFLHISVAGGCANVCAEPSAVLARPHQQRGARRGPKRQHSPGMDRGAPRARAVDQRNLAHPRLQHLHCLCREAAPLHSQAARGRRGRRERKETRPERNAERGELRARGARPALRRRKRCAACEPVSGSVGRVRPGAAHHGGRGTEGKHGRAGLRPGGGGVRARRFRLVRGEGRGVSD